MSGQNVKNTIVERVLQIIAPHPCLQCGKIGSVLCSYCKYDIIEDSFSGCFLCGKACVGGVCKKHISPLERVFIVNRREGALEVLINKLKFSRLKSAARTLGDLLHDSLPLLPQGTTVVPIPTIAQHMRQRGYDHARLLTQHFAAYRQLNAVPLLKRASKTVQHEVDRAQRHAQARAAFVVDEKALALVRNDQPILLVDDIVTTGATLEAAARLLVGRGFTVWAAVLAYQPLD